MGQINGNVTPCCGSYGVNDGNNGRIGSGMLVYAVNILFTELYVEPVQTGRPVVSMKYDYGIVILCFIMVISYRCVSARKTHLHCVFFALTQRYIRTLIYLFRYTMKPVYTDYLYNKIYYLWFIQ